MNKEKILDYISYAVITILTYSIVRVTFFFFDYFQFGVEWLQTHTEGILILFGLIVIVSLLFSDHIITVTFRNFRLINDNYIHIKYSLIERAMFLMIDKQEEKTTQYIEGEKKVK